MSAFCSRKPISFDTPPPLLSTRLLQRVGPRLGLITTRGHEDMLFIGNGRAWGDGLPVSEQRRVAQAKMPEPLITRDMVVGVGERVDCFGKVIRPLREEEVFEALQYLVDRGVQGIVVSLLWSSANSAHERAIRDIIRDEYPEVYLGNIPVLLSSDIVTKWREYTRTTTSMLTGFLHTELTNQLLGIGDRLRDLGYKRPLQMVQNTGGVAKLTRTRVVDTYQSGPVAGIMGAAARARSLGLKTWSAPTWAAPASTSESSSKAVPSSTPSAPSSIAGRSIFPCSK